MLAERHTQDEWLTLFPSKTEFVSVNGNNPNGSDVDDFVGQFDYLPLLSWNVDIAMPAFEVRLVGRSDWTNQEAKFEAFRRPIGCQYILVQPWRRQKFSEGLNEPSVFLGEHRGGQCQWKQCHQLRTGEQCQVFWSENVRGLQHHLWQVNIILTDVTEWHTSFSCDNTKFIM